jgi:hypothetical protein
MKKTMYTKLEIQIVRLHSACQMLAGSGLGIVNSVSNSEGFTMDSNGLDDSEELR